MISRIIKKTVDLNKVQKVDQLEGPLYQLENGGHTFEITCLMDGAAAAVSGTVSARFLRADGITEYFTGTLSGNVASITLPQACYNVNGRFGMVVFITGSGVTSAVYGVAGSVYKTTSDQVVDPTEVIPSLEDLIAKIQDCEDATEAAEAAAAFVPNVIAPAYASGTAYSAGDYITDSGKLYRVTADITAANNTALSAVSKIQVTAGAELGDLKSALDAFESGENESQIPVGDIQANYVKYSDGKINGMTSTTYGHVGPLPVTGYVKIRYSRIKNTGSSDLFGLAFYGASGFVSGKNCLKNQSEAGYELTEISVPPTATTVAFSVYLDDTTYIPQLIGVRDNKVLEHLAEIDTEIDGVQSQIDEVAEQTLSQIINVFNPANVTVGKKTYFGTGNKITTLRDQANSALSEIMPCKEGDVITIRPGIAGTSTGTASNYGVVIADADGTIIAGLQQPDQNSRVPYSITVPEGGVMFRFNVNTNYESNLALKYCTINRGSLDYAVPYGNVEVHRASENMVGGITAPDKTSKDTQQVTIDPTTGAAYVNLHPASEEKRRLFVPGKVYMPSGTKPRAYWRCLSWVRNPASVYYRHPTANTSLTQRCMPEYFQMTDSTISGKRYSSQLDMFMFDAAREIQIDKNTFNACYINPTALDNPQTAKNLLIIGDSFTYNIAKRVKARLTAYGLTGINMIGSKTAEDGTVYAGYGGHGYKEYIADPATLTSPMTNPFWHNGAVDIQWFVQSQCSASTVDYVIIHLGVNDMLDGRTNTQIIGDMQTFVGYIRTAYPNVKIVIDGLVIPAMACPSNYNPVDRALKIHLYNVDLEAAVDEMTGTYYAPVVFFFPVEYAYPYTMSAPCEGSTETVKTLTDYLHPYTPGYYQIADEALWCLLYNAEEL